jgi:hypothetical protein
MTLWIPVVELFDRRQKKETLEDCMVEGESNEIVSHMAASEVSVGDEKATAVKASGRKI